MSTESTQELVQKNDSAPVVNQPRTGTISPLVNMLASKMQEITIEQARELMELQKEFEKDEARKAFYADSAQARLDLPMIGKNRSNSYLNTNYADLDTMIAGAGPVLGKHNLSFTFDYDQTVEGKVATYCIRTHALGHTERVKVIMPVMKPMQSNAGKAVTNESQMVGIAMTYGRRQSFAAAFGIATGDDNDGNMPEALPPAPPVEMLTESDMHDMEALCTELGRDYGKFTNWASGSDRPLVNGLLQGPKSDKGFLIGEIRRGAAAAKTNEKKKAEKAEMEDM